VALIATCYLFFKGSDNDTYWTKRISDLEKRADSLSKVVDAIDIKLNKKDSILLTYMASLDKTLEELNKETQKNKKTLETNFAKQDSMRLEFCRQMAELGQKPDDCKN
jgi:hypothetical protein